MDSEAFDAAARAGYEWSLEVRAYDSSRLGELLTVWPLFGLLVLSYACHQAWGT